MCKYTCYSYFLNKQFLVFSVINISLQDHPNIIRIFDTYKDAKCTYIVEEYIAKCATLTKLFENEKCFVEGNRALVVEQILKALNYLHQNNLCHRDLKPDNVIFTNKPPIDFKKLDIKLIDFGFAKATLAKDDLTDFVGTPFYIAPEIINKKKYGSKCDIWSLGVMTYLLLCG